MKATFSITPESERVILELAKSSKRWPQIADRCVKRVAEKCAEDVKKRIESQAFPNVRITDAWLARKMKEGLDTRTLMATRRYYKSIRAERSSPRLAEWGVVCNDLSLRDWLENGTRRGNPPRPHWGPVLIDYQLNFSRHFAEEVVKEVFAGVVKP